MTDVLMTHTPDGGEIEIISGTFTTTEGLETAAYLSLFGGNADDEGLKGNVAKQWWANHVETDENRRIRGRTQYLLRTLPPTSGNLLRVKDAVNGDLAWMVTELGAAVTVNVRIPQFSRLEIDILILIDGKKTPIKFNAPWSS